MSAGNKNSGQETCTEEEPEVSSVAALLRSRTGGQRVMSCDEDEGRDAGRHGVSRSVHAN